MNPDTLQHLSFATGFHKPVFPANVQFTHKKCQTERQREKTSPQSFYARSRCSEACVSTKDECQENRLSMEKKSHHKTTTYGKSGLKIHDK